MSHESLAKMVEYSHKMIDTIAKEVVDNFITRKEFFVFFDCRNSEMSHSDANYSFWKLDVTKSEPIIFTANIYQKINRFCKYSTKDQNIRQWNSSI